jgi:hypothetical protein
MINRLHMVFERLIADGDALFDECGLGGGERVAVDCVGGVGELEFVDVLEIVEAPG